MLNKMKHFDKEEFHQLPIYPLQGKLYWRNTIYNDPLDNDVKFIYVNPNNMIFNLASMDYNLWINNTEKCYMEILTLLKDKIKDMIEMPKECI